MTVSQLFLFGDAPSIAPKAIVRGIRKNFGPAPEQAGFNLSKLLRKIAFKRRYREKKGEYDKHQYTEKGVLQMHQTLLKEWRERFPVCTNLRDQYSYWAWILGNPADAFSFHDCLVADGYTRPSEVIDALEIQAPAWFTEIQHLTELEQVARLKQMVEENGLEVPSVRAA